jgi:nucleotide-binding universal stress UspA family protein
VRVIICVATDLAPSFERTIEHALLWAKAHEATVVLLHVVHDPELAPALASDVPGDLTRAQKVLQQIADRSDVPCRVEVRAADNVATEIVKASKNAAYLFMGSQGKSAFERLRLGSIATAVMRQSHVPLVCLPHVVPEE